MLRHLPSNNKFFQAQKPLVNFIQIIRNIHARLAIADDYFQGERRGRAVNIPPRDRQFPVDLLESEIYFFQSQTLLTFLPGVAPLINGIVDKDEEGKLVARIQANSQPF